VRFSTDQVLAMRLVIARVREPLKCSLQVCDMMALATQLALPLGDGQLLPRCTVGEETLMSHDAT
jgi:hypothetical protein